MKSMRTKPAAAVLRRAAAAACAAAALWPAQAPASAEGEALFAAGLAAGMTEGGGAALEILLAGSGFGGAGAAAAAAASCAARAAEAETSAGSLLEAVIRDAPESPPGEGGAGWRLAAGVACGIGLAAGKQRSAGPPAERASASEEAPAAGTPPLPGRPESPLAAFGAESFWIRLGEADSPGVYMLADPGCPHCAAALLELAPEITGGRLHARLALAPFLSEASRDLAAGIMLAADPANAAWEMLLEAARGNRPAPEAGAYAAIGEVGEALLAANLGWMRRNGVDAVPHFIWRDAGGWRQAGGVQSAGTFAGAEKLEGGSDVWMNAPAAALAVLGQDGKEAEAPR